MRELFAVDLPQHREDWQEYIENEVDDDDYGGYYDVAPAWYWTLPCRPIVMAIEGVIYYVCDSVWYTHAYIDDNLVYTVVPNPTGHE